MADYRVNLEIYNGPLDLLLYLIRRSEVEIHDISIAAITEQYLAYVDLLKELNINNASEFLVMASTLLEIKSAMILPRPTEIDEEGEDDLSDPRLELVRQLLEYKKFKDAARELHDAADDQSQRWPRSMADLKNMQDEFKQHQQQELDLEGLQIWDLFDTFNKLIGKGLLDYCSNSEIAKFTLDMHAMRKEAWIAGSISRDELPDLWATGVDVICVRGAACATARGDGRFGQVTTSRVQRLIATLDRTP